MTSSFSNNELPSYPKDECSGSSSASHYFCHIQLGVFQCKCCGAAKWQPQDVGAAMEFSRDVSKLGINKVYYICLLHKPAVVTIIRALEATFAVRANVDEETAKVVSNAMMPKVRKATRRKTQAKERLGIRRKI